MDANFSLRRSPDPGASDLNDSCCFLAAGFGVLRWSRDAVLVVDDDDNDRSSLAPARMALLAAPAPTPEAARKREESPDQLRFESRLHSSAQPQSGATPFLDFLSATCQGGKRDCNSLCLSLR